MIPRKSSGQTFITLIGFANRMIWQLRLSRLFGNLDLVILGDSNGEELADYASMKLFPKLSANIAIGGTRADHWAQFFTLSSQGIDIAKRIKDKKVVINIGGNHVIQNSMENLKESIQTLNKLFPKAYWINLPSVHASHISALTGRNLKHVSTDLRTVNEEIQAVAKDRLIDMRSYTGSTEYSPYFGVLKDSVHFADDFDRRVRIPLILGEIYGEF